MNKTTASTAAQAPECTAPSPLATDGGKNAAIRMIIEEINAYCDLMGC